MKTLVKICGLSEPRGLAAAVDAGAAFVGFVFYRRSPRYVTVEQAVELAALVPRGIKKVGLFVDPIDNEIERVMQAVRLDLLQLHGHETPERIDAIRLLAGLPVIKAVGIATPRDALAAKVYDDHADWLLFDAKAPKDATRPGGNAQSFDWASLKAYTGKTPWLLAGGLSRANIAAALRESGARAVDVSSGVETAPGVKSAAKIRAFIKAVEAAQKAKALA